MNEDWYFVITNSEGDTCVRGMSRTELLEKLAEDYWGSEPMSAEQWATAPADTNYWAGGRMLIIKGAVAKVTPPGDWRVE